MASKRRPRPSKSWDLVKSKKQTKDVFGDAQDKETSEDCGKAFEHAIGSAGGLDMPIMDYRINKSIADVIRRIAASAVEDLGSSLVSYVVVADGHPCNFVLADGRTLEVRFSRNREFGEGYPPMSGQTSWASFVEAFSMLRPGVPVPLGRDDGYAKEMFIRCWPRMLRMWLADMFCSDVTVWAWASGVSGPGYVVVKQCEVGWPTDLDPDKKEWDLAERRKHLPQGLHDGDFSLAKQEVPEWKTMSNEIRFYWNASKGEITIGTFKLQRHRKCIQFGFRMLNLMMILGVAARRTERMFGMFECLPLKSRKERPREPASQAPGI